MKKFHLVLLFGLITLATSSCAPILIGLGALGGYAISEDTLEGVYRAEKAEAFQISKNALLDWTNDVMEDEAQKELIATSDKKRVWVFVDQLTPDSVRVRVKARKYGMKDIKALNTYALPDVRTAQLIFERIVTPLHKKTR